GGENLRPAVLVAEALLGPPQHALHEAVGHDRAGIDRHHAHAVADAVAAEALHHHVERGVAHAAGDIVGIGALTGGADHADDHALAALGHAGEIRTREVDVAEDLEVPGLAPGLAVDLFQRAARDAAGVVDQ